MERTAADGSFIDNEGDDGNLLKEHAQDKQNFDDDERPEGHEKQKKRKVRASVCVSARPRPRARRRKSLSPSLRTPSEERAPLAARAGARRGGGGRWRRRRGRRRPLQPDNQVCRHSRVPVPSSFISPTFVDLRHTQISRVVQFKHRARVPVCCAPSALCGWMIVRIPRARRAMQPHPSPQPPSRSRHRRCRRSRFSRRRSRGRCARTLRTRAALASRALVALTLAPRARRGGVVSCPVRAACVARAAQVHPGLG